MDFLNRNPVIQSQPEGASLRVVGLIAKDRMLHAQMLNCTCPSDALALYNLALQVLSTHAKEELIQSMDQTLLVDGRIHLDGPVS